MLLPVFAAILATASPSGTPSPCEALIHDEAAYTVCALDLNAFDLSLYWKDSNGDTIAQPSRLKPLLEADGKTVALMTNGGMYHADRRPVGLFVSDGLEQRPLVQGDGPGNFQLLPNGVFFIEDGVAGILETNAYADLELAPEIATQSGPMLVIDGALHPAFREASDSTYRRSGIGVSSDGRTVWIVISEEAVNFHSFARVFRDALELDNALYLDGKVSRLDVPADGRREFGLAMGPILAAIHTLERDDTRDRAEPASSSSEDTG